MKGTVHIVNPEREETVPQNQIPLQANQINITNNPVGNNTYIERYPQMKFVQDPKYRIHANFRPEVTEITIRLAEAVREAVWDCQRSSTYTQEAFESNMKKHLESVPKVTVVSYGMIQKIDQFGNPWVDWMEGKESYELLQQSLLKIPLKQGTANVQYVPLETEEETEEQEEEKPLWERAWDSIKETASDVWDTVTSKEFREKALAIGGTILVAAAATAAVIATAGAAGPAMGAVVTYLGGSAAMAGAATTATTVGGYVIAGAVVADAVNTSAEVVTGTNYIAKGAYELFGNENWTEEDFLNLYWEGKELLYMGAHGYSTFGANAMAAGYSSQKSVEMDEVKTLQYKTTSGVKLTSKPEKTTTILGRYDSDTKNIIQELNLPKSTDFSGNRGGFNLLNTPDELYRTPIQFWNEYNKKFLDAAIKRGDEILMSTPINNSTLYTKTGELTGYGNEYFYLRSKGYELIDGKMIFKGE
jgi:hypothetical protein